MSYAITAEVEAITSQIVKIAPGAFTPASFGWMVAKMANVYKYQDETKFTESEAKIAAVHRESRIKNAAAEIAFASGHVPTPINTCSQPMISAFDVCDVAENIATAVASICPEIVTDTAAVALATEVMNQACITASAADLRLLFSLRRSHAKLKRKSGSALTVENLIAQASTEADQIIKGVDATIAQCAPEIVCKVVEKYSQNPEEMLELLKERAKTWVAPATVFDTIPSRCTEGTAVSSIAPPKYSDVVARNA